MTADQQHRWRLMLLHSSQNEFYLTFWLQYECKITFFTLIGSLISPDSVFKGGRCGGIRIVFNDGPLAARVERLMGDQSAGSGGCSRCEAEHVEGEQWNSSVALAWSHSVSCFNMHKKNMLTPQDRLLPHANAHRHKLKQSRGGFRPRSTSCCRPPSLLIHKLQTVLSAADNKS